jgi:hypothetical protein
VPTIVLPREEENDEHPHDDQNVIPTCKQMNICL